MAFACVLMSEAVKCQLTLWKSTIPSITTNASSSQKTHRWCWGFWGKTEKLVLWLITIKESLIQTKCPNPITHYGIRAASCRQSTVINDLTPTGRNWICWQCQKIELFTGVRVIQRIWSIVQEKLFLKSMKSLHHTESNKKRYLSQPGGLTTC